MSSRGEERATSCCELIAEVAREFGEVRFRATGMSMMPSIRPGDVLTVRRCEAAEIQPEDVILFRRGTGVTAHRVRLVTSEAVITQGDSIGREDAPVPYLDIIGRVESMQRRGRNVVPQQTIWSRGGSLLLRHSSFCMRVAAFVAYRRLGSKPEEFTWAHP